MPIPRKLAGLLALILSIAPGLALGQSWPTKPVKLVNGFPAGGGADILARLVAERLTAALGQQVIVENRTSATGMIAVSRCGGGPTATRCCSTP